MPFTGYGVLRGSICDTNSGLWSFLPGLDHTDYGVCCSVEVSAYAYKGYYK